MLQNLIETHSMNLNNVPRKKDKSNILDLILQIGKYIRTSSYIMNKREELHVGGSLTTKPTNEIGTPNLPPIIHSKDAMHV